MDLKKAKENLKNNEKTKFLKAGKLPVIKVGPNKKAIRILWGILIFSTLFGVYKNFTAVDKETIYEREIVNEKLKDTSAVESFVIKFAEIYHTWGNTSGEIEERKQKISQYLTEGLVKINADTITTDCPVTSVVTDVSIWSLEEAGEDEYSVKYSVNQNLMESGNPSGQEINTKETGNDNNMTEIENESFYTVTVHVEDSGKMVIVRNPTISSRAEKSGYIPAEMTLDGSVSNTETAEIDEFLKTFFSLYPTATQKELSYYVKDNVLPVIQEEYIFGGLMNPVYSKDEEGVKVYVYVQYLDQKTKITQIAQYAFTLEKGDNWKIIKAE